MAKKKRFDFTKKNKRTGNIENVGYLDLSMDQEQSKCSLYFYGDIVSATWQSMWYEEDKCPQDIADFLNQLDGCEDIDIKRLIYISTPAEAMYLRDWQFTIS